MKSQEKINQYKGLLPSRIQVQLAKDEKGVWASILDLPHCYTQATDVNELPELITDLVLTHFEIPEKFRNKLGSYIPLSDSHVQLEESLRRLIDIETKTRAGKEVNQTFTRTQTTLA